MFFPDRGQISWTKLFPLGKTRHLDRCSNPACRQGWQEFGPPEAACLHPSPVNHRGKAATLKMVQLGFQQQFVFCAKGSTCGRMEENHFQDGWPDGVWLCWLRWKVVQGTSKVHLALFCGSPVPDRWCKFGSRSSQQNVINAVSNYWAI